MNKLDGLKAKFPTLEINLDGATDFYQEGVDIVERENVAVIIKHPYEEKFLLADWKNSKWKGLVTGGIGKDSIERTTLEEIREETGYRNIAKITDLKYVSHSLFFHPVKKENRLAHYNLTLAELSDLEQNEISEEEQSIADFIWIHRDKVLDLITRDSMKELWMFYINKQKFTE